MLLMDKMYGLNLEGGMITVDQRSKAYRVR
jgi:hypothetical protein